jgi:L-cysteine S-thiosulfotransferase
MGPSTRQLQDDDAQNPAFLWVAGGAEAWQAVPTPPAPPSARSCQGCHGDLATAMRGVAARYPAHDAGLGRVLTLGQRINQCRSTRQGGAPWAAESDTLLGLEAAIALASRGLPITPGEGAALDAARERGRALYFRRMGQLNLSCAQCHDERAGLRLGGATIPQAHPSGYPLYRLEWQALGSLQRRLRGCLTGVRAEPFAADSPDWVALEAYLKQRAAGLALDAPAVRP